MSDTLAGVKVVDLGRIIAGPMAGMLLGDLGADVVKVETGPFGDGLRGQSPAFGEGFGGYFATANRNKRSLHIDLRHPGGRRVLERLMQEADILIENFRPGVFEAMGFPDDVLRRDFPKLIVGRMSAYGNVGPMAHLAGVDQLVQGRAGLMAVTGTAESGPVRSGIAVSDVMGALCMTIGLLGALAERNRSGQGQVVRSSLLEATLAMMSVQAGKYFASGTDPVPEGNHHPMIAPYGLFPTKDGQIQILVSRDSQFRRFCEMCGHPEWAVDSRFATGAARSRHKDLLRDLVSEAMPSRTTAEWQALLEEADIPHGPVLSVKEAFEDAQARALGMPLHMTARNGAEITVPGFPWRFERTPASVRRPPPCLGEHTKEILAELGLGEDAQVRDAVDAARRAAAAGKR